MKEFMKIIEEVIVNLLAFVTVVLPGPALMIVPSLTTMFGWWSFPDDYILKLFFIGMGYIALVVLRDIQIGGEQVVNNHFSELRYIRDELKDIKKTIYDFRKD